MEAPRIPAKPSLDGLEAKWSARWESEGTYRFDRSRPRPEVYAIDTPPPTVSGSLHVGHVFSYSQTDVVARFQRMRGKAVFYPIGWDDNGLATERRVQNFFGVRCDPSQAYVEDFKAPSPAPSPAVGISRPNFVELCYELTATDEGAFEDLFRRVGLSFDWAHSYTTIDEVSRRTSQAAFLRMLARNEAYRAEAPTLWDVDFRTAVAQAELEDRERPGAYHRIRFARAEGGTPIEIETTRPELIPSCVALVAHPDDARYAPLFGTAARTPLFGVEVPVLSHRLADPDKGSGIAMVCTFGDTTDVQWWRDLGLATRTVVQRDGRLGEAPFGEPGWESSDPAGATAAYGELAGKGVGKARERIVELLRDSGDLVGEVRPIVHAVKFYERGERPLEIVSSKQWFVRSLAMRERLLDRGRELSWHPEFMRGRFETWVEGLASDWNVSRQRYFGVPFPIWYRLGEDGEAIEGAFVVPDERRLPVDPSTDVPEGYEAAQRDRPEGFSGDPDVMDTWATSSLTPQISGGWIDDPDLFARVFPMDLRPQAHDIIRTWLFSTVVRAELEHGELPWRHAAVSGWILDPDRKKMSKSKGNVAVPIEPIEEYGADAVRYWAASARLGADAAYDTQQMRVGRRLAIKILNVSRFVLSRAAGGATGKAAVTAPIDVALLARLRGVVAEATAALEGYEHARALELTESFFWSFCDDYVELVKARAYGAGGDAAAPPAAATSNGAASATAALVSALGVLLRLLAPFLPYCTEEAWSWWHEGSVHLARWPEPEELDSPAGASLRLDGLLDTVAEVLSAARRAKSERHLSMRAPIARLAVSGPLDRIALVESARDDLVAAGGIAELCLTGLADRATGAELEIDVDLGA